MGQVKETTLASSVDLKELLFYRIEERVSENHSDYFWTEVTRSIQRVTSCEFMEWRTCNLIGCKVAQMYLSTKIYDKEANLASWYRSFMGS